MSLIVNQWFETLKHLPQAKTKTDNFCHLNLKANCLSEFFKKFIVIILMRHNFVIDIFFRFYYYKITKVSLCNDSLHE